MFIQTKLGSLPVVHPWWGANSCLCYTLYIPDAPCRSIYIHWGGGFQASFWGDTYSSPMGCHLGKKVVPKWIVAQYMFRIYFSIYLGVSIQTIPGALKTMKNKGFHIQKPCFLLGKTRFLMICGAPGSHSKGLTWSDRCGLPPPLLGESGHVTRTTGPRTWQAMLWN